MYGLRRRIGATYGVKEICPSSGYDIHGVSETHWSYMGVVPNPMEKNIRVWRPSHRHRAEAHQDMKVGSQSVNQMTALFCTPGFYR